MKKLVFHLLALALLATLLATAGGVVDKILEGDRGYTIVQILSTIGTFLAGYYGLGSALAEIYKRFKGGIVHDFLHFLLVVYFKLHSPIKEIKSSDIDRIHKTLKKGIKEHCKQSLNEKRILKIKEIPDLPFTCYDNLDDVCATKDTLIQTVCDFHTDHFDGATTSFIIGEAGAGKSFAIKQITQHLLDKSYPKTIIPILLPISSWQKDSDIYGWIVATTCALYTKGEFRDHVHELITNTPDNYEIIYLLDGLDEIRNDLMEVFFREMNRILGEKHVVIGSRKEVFYLFKEKGLLNHFQYYELQALHHDKIAVIIRENIQEDKQDGILSISEVYEKFNTPLLIGLLAKVVNSVTDISKVIRADAMREYVWDKFSEIVYAEKSKNGYTKFHYSLATLRNYAGWMAKREERAFSLDDLQPAVLESTALQWIYSIITRLLIGVIISIGIGFTMSGPLDFIPAGLLGGMISITAFLLPTERWFYHDGDHKRVTPAIGVKIFAASLAYLIFSLIVFGVYFSVSGQRRDMIHIIAPADWIIGILFAIMFTVLGAIRDFRYGFHNDIQLIQKRSIFRLDALDFPTAFLFAFVFSLIVGVICASLSVFFVDAFPQNIFTGWIKDNSTAWGMNIFTMAFFMVLPVAAGIGLLVGLNNPKYYKFDEVSSVGEKEQQLPYFSVSNTIFSSLALSLLVMILVAISWSIVNMQTFKTGWEGGNKGIESGLAAGIFIGLWWGWKDIIKIWVLRLLLFIKGQASLSFTKMLKDFEILGIVICTGARFTFLDPTLHTYLRSEAYEKAHMVPPRRINWILPLLIISIIAILSVRIYWKSNYYWQMHNEGLHITSSSEAVRPLTNLQVLVSKSGQLQIKSQGLVRVGRILGRVTPLGTGTGFFGMPLNSSFNILPAYKHGALMYRRSSSHNWQAVYGSGQPQFMDTYMPSKIYTETIPVSENDTLEFALNDTEWQNNSKGFQITLDFIPPSDSILQKSK